MGQHEQALQQQMQQLALQHQGPGQEGEEEELGQQEDGSDVSEMFEVEEFEDGGEEEEQQQLQVRAGAVPAGTCRLGVGSWAGRWLRQRSHYRNVHCQC